MKYIQAALIPALERLQLYYYISQYRLHINLTTEGADWCNKRYEMWMAPVCLIGANPEVH